MRVYLVLFCSIKLTGNDLTGVRSVITLGQECENSAVKEWNNLR